MLSKEAKASKATAKASNATVFVVGSFTCIFAENFASVNEPLNNYAMYYLLKLITTA
jgi:hypothetical protein